MTRWFEDVVIGETFALGTHEFTAEAIRSFGQRFDPQVELAAPGDLVASGLHVAAIGHRKMVDALFAEERRLREAGREPGETGPSPGGDLLNFTALVRPGDRISYQLTVTGKRTSNSIPGWGLLLNHLAGANQEGETVYEASFVGFSKLRDYRPTLRHRLASALTLLRRLRRLRHP